MIPYVSMIWILYRFAIFWQVTSDNMTKFDVFDILFDNPKRAYYAGELLQGSVALACSEPLKVNSK